MAAINFYRAKAARGGAPICGPTPPAKSGVNGSSMCVVEHRQDRANKANSHDPRHWPWVCVSARAAPFLLAFPTSAIWVKFRGTPALYANIFSQVKNGVDNDPGFHSYTWTYTVGKLTATVQTGIAVYDNGIQGGVPPANTWFHIAAAWDNAISTVTTYV